MKQRKSERIEMLQTGSGDLSFFDLSKTGVCCLHSRTLPKGRDVSVEINDLQIDASVVYSVERTDGARIGLQFKKPKRELAKKIDTLVEGYSRGVPVNCRILEPKDPAGK